MSFKSDKQRKAVMAKFNSSSGNNSPVTVKKGFRRIRVTKDTKKEQIQRFLKRKNTFINKIQASKKIRPLDKKAAINLLRRVNSPKDVKNIRSLARNENEASIAAIILTSSLIFGSIVAGSLTKQPAFAVSSVTGIFALEGALVAKGRAERQLAKEAKKFKKIR